MKRTIGYHCNTEVKLLCYCSLIRPLVEFSSQLWSCNYNRKLLIKVESLQRRATKFILNDYNSSYEDRLNMLELLPLSFRREFLDLMHLYNCNNDLIDMNVEHLPSPIIHDVPRTRLEHDDLKLTVPKTRYISYANFYLTRVAHLWNCLPYNIRDLELTPSGYNSCFKAELKTWFIDLLKNKFKSNNICTWVVRCQCNQCKY